MQVAPAIILGLYWERSHSKSVFAGMLVGAVVAATFTFLGLTPLGIFSGVLGLMINLVIYVGGSFIFGIVPAEKEETSLSNNESGEPSRL